MEELREIRCKNYEKTKKMTMKEEIRYINDKANKVMKKYGNKNNSYAGYNHVGSISMINEAKDNGEYK